MGKSNLRVKYVESATPPRFDVIDFLFKGGGRGRVRRRFAERNSSILSHSEKREGPHPTNMVPQCVCVCVLHTHFPIYLTQMSDTREREREKKERRGREIRLRPQQQHCPPTTHFYFVGRSRGRRGKE